MTCLRCGDPAIAVFEFDRGCYCDPARVQALCVHHAFKSGPIAGGSMTMISDLSEGQTFGDHWAPKAVSA